LTDPFNIAEETAIPVAEFDSTVGSSRDEGCALLKMEVHPPTNKYIVALNSRMLMIGNVTSLFIIVHELPLSVVL
jgi:hypothetical protein